MFETYRLLGREREGELMREAQRLGRLDACGARRLRVPVLALALAIVGALVIWTGVSSAANAPIAITFEKHWIGPGHYIGTTSGDGTVEIQLTSSIVTGNMQHFDVTISVTRPSGSFTASCSGTFNFITYRTLLNGVITQGVWQGAQVREEGQLVNVDPLTFTGTLFVMPATANQ